MMTRPSSRQSAMTTDSSPTVPITAFEDIFRALPEGALLGSETYYVAGIRSEGASCNVYGVEEARPMFPCPNLECCDRNPNGVCPALRLCKHRFPKARWVSLLCPPNGTEGGATAGRNNR